MEEKRKEIIIHEIKKWRESQLLPRTYCDFLLGLYSEGNLPEDESAAIRPSAVLKKAGRTLALLIGFITVLIFFIYFTQFPPPLQLAVLASIFLISSGAGFYYRKREPLYMHIYILLATFISFILLVVTADLFFGDDRFFLGLGIVFLCLIWAVSGKFFKLPYLYIAGGTGIVLLIGFMLAEQL
ncbi:hypothetical protein [Salisediminibacterium halotolerans]|uniref:hypothetical protein n=1 Tax=Salisediminibacterium halotolerans TaxID=517425 RepID=UPI000EAE0863|nr:hypothetical protein [Salisediminibacterium halotolerans]RLJ78143.1 hypothetical protein BCL39_0613 [Actinophytocola xinjiangensis]RPE88518.1 hypothetical protein EDD67_0846 [Salisediminibacterium halotolerans]TWG37120.1 hypothetical protein BCL52_0612 [Salisediminibacterium halotolerans]GEL07258.1 hypothetical protein SHA02_06740 [Salisediminibacterium halotolerans]